MPSLKRKRQVSNFRRGDNMSNNLLITRDPYFSAAQEDRSAPRTRVSIPATLRVSGGRGFQTVVHDLSLSGFCAAVVNRIHNGTICWLTLPGIESLQAEVVWWDNSLSGCAFDKMISPIVLDNILTRWRSDTVYRQIL
jgi:PilZ domain